MINWRHGSGRIRNKFSHNQRIAVWRGTTSARRRVGRFLFSAKVEIDDNTSDLIGIAVGANSGPTFHLDIRRAVTIWAVRELEHRLTSGELDGASSPVALRICPEDVPFLARLASEKSCQYQRQYGRDLYCAATDKELDNTFVWQDGPHSLAPTSKPQCKACELPDTDFLCSHLHHPRIGSEGVIGKKTTRRWLYGAFCDIDSEALATGKNCRPGGNECWIRSARREPEPIRTQSYSAPALSIAFDHLDAVWRLVFGKEKKLLRLARVSDGATLEVDCLTREEFQSRLSSLADTMKAIYLPDDLVHDPSIRPDQTLKRLASCLSPPVLGTDQMESIKAAVGKLAAIVDLRNVGQHANSRVNPAPAYARLGISYPPSNWKEAWDQIRSQATGALNVISSELNKRA